jgi:predicted transcriptional regulator of viral defense system
MPTTETMVNRDYQPNQHEHDVMDFITAEECPRVTNGYVRKQLDKPPERVDPALNNLRKAGWLRRLDRGFYELVDDPRKSSKES